MKVSSPQISCCRRSRASTVLAYSMTSNSRILGKLSTIKYKVCCSNSSKYDIYAIVGHRPIACDPMTKENRGTFKTKNVRRVAPRSVPSLHSVAMFFLISRFFFRFCKLSHMETHANLLSSKSIDAMMRYIFAIK